MSSSKQLEISSKNATKTGVRLICLTIFDMIWLTSFMDSAVWVTTGMKFSEFMEHSKV